MSVRGRRVLGVLIVVTLVVLGGGGYVLYALFGTPVQYDSDFYADLPAESVFSYDAYAAALKVHVDDAGRVHYAGLQRDRADLDAFARAMATLDRETYDAWSDTGKVAFWINAYNALTLKLIVDNYPIQPDMLRSLAYPDNSIRQIPGAWEKVQFLVMGERVTLDHIEHTILRGRFKEARIHMALVCAAMSCPPLRNDPYRAAHLDGQLSDQARKFLAAGGTFRIDRGGGTVHLSQIFQWFGADFVPRWSPKDPANPMAKRDASGQAVLTFIAASLHQEDAGYIRTGEYSVEYLPYDWSLNERPLPLTEGER